MEDIAAWPIATPLRLSRGHFAEPVLAEVRVNPESRDAYVGLVIDRPMPDGSTLAMLHRDPRTSIAAQLFVMEKLGGAWTYTIVDEQGRVSARGALALCENCHALAPADHLFGTGSPPPTPADPKTSAGSSAASATPNAPKP